MDECICDSCFAGSTAHCPGTDECRKFFDATSHNDMSDDEYFEAVKDLVDVD